MNVPYDIRPIDTWPGEPTPAGERRRSPFGASRSVTLDQLDRELHYLGAKDVSLLMAVADADIRLDGQLRANARPTHPGVVLAFDSTHGPLKYAVDTFADAWANLRAIALGLEALRKVDRYGVTKRGEQYTGWKQLPSGTQMPAAMTLEEAATFVARNSEDVMPEGWEYHATRIIEDADEFAQRVRQAARRLHPDMGGDTADFQRLQDAKLLLEAHHA